MNCKAFEVRDKATFIPVVGVLMVPPDEYDSPAEEYLLRRAGYGPDQSLVLLCRMEAEGTQRNATYDPFAWRANGTRTLFVAHKYIAEHWHELRSGQVIDVEFILGETPQPKLSERDSEKP